MACQKPKQTVNVLHRMAISPLRRLAATVDAAFDIPPPAAFVLSLGFLAVLPAPTFAGSESVQASEAATWREEALALEHGEGIAKNPAKAVELYCKGARAGDAESRYSLAWMYMNGRGMPRNDRNDAWAAYLFKQAADQGHAPSQKMLAFVGEPSVEPPECLRQPDAQALSGNIEEGSFDNEQQRRLAALISRLAPEYGVSPQFAYAVARTESNLNPKAVSPKNAQGLMQLIPDTSARFNVKKPFDPEQNIRGGLAYLRWLLAYFRGDVALVAAAYNAGEGAVNQYLGIPPYQETRHYVKRILAAFPQREHPFNPTITEASPNMLQIAKRMRKTTQ
jgi:TPR repeat protein